MARTTNKVNKSSGTRKRRPALTPEARESQIIALAMDRAEQMILDGTASSQVITHFLKLGSEKERLEREKLKKENELLRAKTESLQSAKDIKELYTQAISAFAIYHGDTYEDDTEYEEE